MILVNTDYITGKTLNMLGIVKGSTIQTKNIGKDISQGFKTLVGGELKAYNEMMNEARALATKRMVEEGPWCRCYCEYSLCVQCNHGGSRRGHCLWYSGNLPVKAACLLFSFLFYTERV